MQYTRWVPSIALVGVLVSAQADAVPCRVSEPAPAILTTPAATTDDTGGIVAANPQTGWELAQSSRAVELRPRVVAPGLAVIPLPTNGAFELHDANKAVLASV